MDDVLARFMPSGPRLSIERIVGHERMPGARKAYIDQFLAVYGNDPFMVRLLIESGRFLVFQLSTLLHAAQEPARRETWFTLGRLKQVIAQYGLGSPRQIDHLVARLCAVGFLESRPSEQDRRLRILRPTDSLLAHDRAWLVAHYAPLAYLFPDHDYGHVMRGDPDFQIVHRRVGMAFLPMGMKVLQSAPELMLFFNRAGGVLVLAALLKAAMEEPAGAPAALSYGEIGDRFGVSRTHVRQMLEGAQSAGLMKVSGRGGRSVEVLPPMWSSYDRALAGGMQIHDMIHVAALREIGAPASDGA